MSIENGLSTLQQGLKEVVEANPITGRHSYFQMKYFIVNKEPTIQSKLWKCLQEMKGRKENLENIQLEQDEILDRIELFKLEIENTKAELANYPLADTDRIEASIRQRQNARRLVAMQKSLTNLAVRRQEIEEEAAFFLQQFQDLEKIEKVKSYDDFEAQSEYWSARYSNEMNMKLMLEHRVDVELAKAVLSLPDGATVKKELIGALTRQQAAIESQKSALEKERKNG